MPLIKIYYDNTLIQEGLKPDWGFSALIQHNGMNILFDTGGSADTLSFNMQKMGDDPGKINTVFISHAHWDHINGLPAVLKPGQAVYLLKSFAPAFKQKIKETGGKLIEIDGFQEIAPGIYSTGALGKAIKEQSLIIDSDKGLLLITGCSHPGIVDIIRLAKQKFNKNIYWVLGGFHLYNLTIKQIESIIKDIRSLGVSKISPCHCTGGKAINLFERDYAKGFIPVGAGAIINSNEL